MSQYNVPTNNKYGVLTNSNNDTNDYNMEEEDAQQEEQTVHNKQTKPPPIIIHGQTKIHTELVNAIKGSVKCEFNIKYNKNNVNVTINNREDRLSFMNKLKSDEIQFHTYSDTNEKTHAFVVRGLASDVIPDDLSSDLKTRPSLPVVKCYKIASKIKYALHTRVYFERRRNTRKITQCHNCQRWGHATSNCHAKSLCMYCAENHKTTECMTRTQLKCANCKGEHQANDLTCPAYKQKLQWLEENQRQPRQQQHTNTRYHQHKNEDFPPMYKPAPPPTHNAWNRHPEPPQQQETQQQQQQRHPQPLPTPQQQQQPQQHRQQQQQSSQHPPTYTGKPPTTHTQQADPFSELTDQFATLHTLVNIHALIQAVTDLNNQLKTCNSKREIFYTFAEFTKHIDNYDI